MAQLSKKYGFVKDFQGFWPKHIVFLRKIKVFGPDPAPDPDPDPAPDPDPDPDPDPSQRSIIDLLGCFAGII